MTYGDQREGDGGPTLWSYGIVLLRHRFLLFFIPVVAMAVTAALSLSSPREYVAPAAFLPQEPPAASNGLGQVASQLLLATPRPSTTSAQFYMDLLRSREVQRAVALTSYAIPGDSSVSGTLLKYFGLNETDTAASVIRALRRFGSIVDVRGDRTTGLVRLDVRTRHPVLSTLVAARFLELVNDYNLRRRQSQARAEREFVEQRLTAGQQALLDAEEALAAFYKRNRRFQDSPELVADESRLQRAVTLRQQLYLDLAKSHELAKIEEVRNTPVITVIEHPQGFVEPRARGTIRKSAVVGILGAFVAVVLSFMLEYLRRSRLADAKEFGEFMDLWRKWLAGIGVRRF